MLENSILIAGSFHPLIVTVENETENICILAYNGGQIPDIANRSVTNYYRWEYDHGAWKDVSGHEKQYLIPANCSKNNTTFSFFIGIDEHANPGKWVIKVFVNNTETSSSSVNVLIGNFCLFFSSIIGVFEPTLSSRNTLVEKAAISWKEERKLAVSDKNIEDLVDDLFIKQRSTSPEDQMIVGTMEPIQRATTPTSIEESLRSTVSQVPRSIWKDGIQEHTKKVMNGMNNGGVSHHRVRLSGYQRFFALFAVIIFLTASLVPIAVISTENKEGTEVQVLEIQKNVLQGDDWLIQFTTIGQGPLTIRPVNETSWGATRLRLIEVGNETTQFNYTWSNESFILLNFSSSSATYLVLEPQSQGLYILQIDFRNETRFASIEVRESGTQETANETIDHIPPTQPTDTSTPSEQNEQPSTNDANYKANAGDPFILRSLGPDAFGLDGQAMRDVNWDYFWDYFHKESSWGVQRSIDGLSWSWVNDTFRQETTRTKDNSSEKTSFFIIVQKDWFYRLVYQMKPSLHSYYDDRLNSQFLLNFTVGGDEIYSTFFNWSDITLLSGYTCIPSVTNDHFSLVVQKNEKIPAELDGKTIVVDPTFGNTGNGFSRYNIEDNIRGIYASPTATGTASSITARLRISTRDKNVKCALYQYVDHGSSYAGTLIQETETILVGTGSAWQTFNFLSPQPVVTAGTNYYIMVWAQSDLGSAEIYGTSGSIDITRGLTYGGWQSPLTAESSDSLTLSIYCTYNARPTISAPYPADGATGEETIPELEITVDDIDDDPITIIWSSNSSGSWVEFGRNTSVAGGTYHSTNANFSQPGVTYYWRVEITDGIDTVQATYHFTTDGTVPTSSVSTILPYWQTSSPLTIQGIASDTGSGVRTVTLFYRYRVSDTSPWGSWIDSGLVDTNPWVSVSWMFSFDAGIGHYEFYSIACDNATNTESAPAAADAKCGFDTGLTSVVDTINPYWQTSSPLAITATATAGLFSGGLKNVTLFYRYTADNSSWWDSSYRYRHQIAITGQAGAGTSYQVLLKIGESSGSAGANFNLGGHSAQFPSGKDVGGDLRFVDNDDATALDFWVESVSGSAPNRLANVWVEVRDSLSSNAMIYCYYGNAAASNASNGDATFVFFDDFLDASVNLSRWTRERTNAPGSITEYADYIRMASGSTTTPYGFVSLGSSPIYTGFLNNAIRFRARVGSNGIGEVAVRGNNAANTGYKCRFDNRAGEGNSLLKPPYVVGGWNFYVTQDGLVPTGGTWYTYDFKLVGTSHYFYRNDALVRSGTDTSYQTAGEISLQNHYGAYSDFDWVFVKSFVGTTEPVFSSAGSEEGWVLFGVDTTPWSGVSWSFPFPNGAGYYQFYSVAVDNSSMVEPSPTTPDAWCGYDNAVLVSSVSPISPYWQNSPLALTGSANDIGYSGLRNVTLFYRFRADNGSAWGGWVSSGLVDVDPWISVSWSFLFPNGTGHYEFYSIAVDNATNTESAPGAADARCGHTAPPSSYVEAISPYWNVVSPIILTGEVTVSGLIGVRDVTLYFRYRLDNASGWGGWVNSGLVDTDPWVGVSWIFAFVNGTGHYEFYSIASDNSSNTEAPPASADARCGFDDKIPSSWVDPIIPYWVEFAPHTLTGTAVDLGNGLRNVTLYYRYRSSNASGWDGWLNSGLVDETPWDAVSWDFMFGNGTGHYEFYCLASDNNSYLEPYPSVADAKCGFDRFPTITNIVPANGSLGVDLLPELSITVGDGNDELMSVVWSSNSSGSWVVFCQNLSSANGTYRFTNGNFSSRGMIYYWCVNVSDGIGWTQVVLWFATMYPPVVASYDLRNGTGSKLDDVTGLLDVNREYFFTMTVMDLDGWDNVETVEVRAWYDGGSESSSYNGSGNLGGNLNLYFFFNTSSGLWSMLWPDDEARLVVGNCTDAVVNSTTRVLTVSFVPLSQVRSANSNNTWDATPDGLNDAFSWNFEIVVTDLDLLTGRVVGEFGVYKSSSLLPNQNWVDVYAFPGFDDDSNIVTITYSSNYDFNLSVYFEENLTNSLLGTFIPIAGNVEILADADLRDDITADKVFAGIGEVYKIDIFNDSGFFARDNTSQTVDVQFKVYVPFGTFGGKYIAHVAVKIKED